MISVALKPVVRLSLTFAIVWFYQYLISPYTGTLLNVVLVISLSIPTWLLISRVLFPTDDGPFNPLNRD